jgi:hypothetical protein
VSIVLINICGFLACSAVVVIGAKNVYRASQIVPAEEDYDVDIPLEDRNITADVVGLGVEVVGYGLDCAVDVAEKLFDSTPSHWLRDMFTPFQLKADGKYFKYKDGQEEDFEGWEDEAPKFKPGKYEFEM